MEERPHEAPPARVLPEPFAPHRGPASGNCPFCGELLDGEGLAQRFGVSVGHVERLRRKAGLPAVDLALPRHGRRHKGVYRYYLPDVLEWARRRVQNGGGAA